MLRERDTVTGIDSIEFRNGYREEVDFVRRGDVSIASGKESIDPFMDSLVNLQRIQDQLNLCHMMIRAEIDGYYQSDASALMHSLRVVKRAVTSFIGTVENRLDGTGYAERREEVLTDREKEVLAIFAKGCSYAEVANCLNCKLSTIQTHVKSIYKKMGVHSRAEAVHEALRLGVIHI